MQTLEITYHLEGLTTPDSMGTWIVYGGPSLVYVWSPDENEGAGLGLELGGELRKYFLQPLSGAFIGAYIGAGVLWRDGEEYVAAMTTGGKLGWRVKLHNHGLPFDLEPYICLSIKFGGFQDFDFLGDLDPTLYLGTKLDLY